MDKITIPDIQFPSISDTTREKYLAEGRLFLMSTDKTTPIPRFPQSVAYIEGLETMPYDKCITDHILYIIATLDRDQTKPLHSFDDTEMLQFVNDLYLVIHFQNILKNQFKDPTIYPKTQAALTVTFNNSHYKDVTHRRYAYQIINNFMFQQDLTDEATATFIQQCNQADKAQLQKILKLNLKPTKLSAIPEKYKKILQRDARYDTSSNDCVQSSRLYVTQGELPLVQNLTIPPKHTRIKNLSTVPPTTVDLWDTKAKNILNEHTQRPQAKKEKKTTKRQKAGRHSWRKHNIIGQSPLSKSIYRQSIPCPHINTMDSMALPIAHSTGNPYPTHMSKSMHIPASPYIDTMKSMTSPINYTS